MTTPSNDDRPTLVLGGFSLERQSVGAVLIGVSHLQGNRQVGNGVYDRCTIICHPRASFIFVKYHHSVVAYLDFFKLAIFLFFLEFYRIITL